MDCRSWLVTFGPIGDSKGSASWCGILVITTGELARLGSAEAPLESALQHFYSLTLIRTIWWVSFAKRPVLWLYVQHGTVALDARLAAYVAGKKRSVKLYRAAKKRRRVNTRECTKRQTIWWCSRRSGPYNPRRHYGVTQIVSMRGISLALGYFLHPYM